MKQVHASFRALADSTASDWELLTKAFVPFLNDLPNRILSQMGELAHDHGGFPVNRLEHCLQTATRAYQGGQDEEYVVCALLHDIGDILAPATHADLAATILKPYVSPENHWMVEKHGIFQGYYFFHHIGLDRNMRDQFRGHQWFERTAEFCEKYDQPSFDPEFDSMSLEDFAPMVCRVLSADRLMAKGPEA
ncbi:HD domain-containing protein [Sphingorhabdus sp.]|jgi:predicted HD phosphohydrolase|uniref:HD domain-containing protein n=1 Tax=Sphingorhabdus sp. TaxID=1902408 RepID=UPI0037C5DF81